MSAKQWLGKWCSVSLARPHAYNFERGSLVIEFVTSRTCNIYNWWVRAGGATNIRVPATRHEATPHTKQWAMADKGGFTS